jgi:ubiquinone/menaquinone biosynthesis C-methylase UbiE
MIFMSPLTPEMSVIKERLSTVWGAGDWSIIARIIEDGGRNFINRLGIKPGEKLLDVACGDGNLSIPAAKLGALVTGADLVPEWVAQARERAKADGLAIQFDAADAESMPYKDNEFDWVVSMFGAMFAPRPDVAATELLRVCKPGGKIAMANWTAEGFNGRMFKLAAQYVPPPPGVPPPIQWGNETVVRERFGNRVSEIQFKRVMLQESLPMPPADVVEHFNKYFGPTQMAFKALDQERQAKLREDLTNLWKEYNTATDGTTIVDAEYLQVVATKAG